MTALRLDAEVQFVKGVGPRRAEQLARLGITTVKDLMFHFPVRYEDRRNVRPIESLTEGETCTIRGVIHETNEKRLRFGKSLFQMGIRDATGILRCVWFNVRSDYLKKKYSVGQHVVATGRVHLGKTERSFEMPHPDIVVLDEGEDETAGGILPFYPLTGGINQGTMRKIVAAALAAAPPVPPVPENLPAAMLERLHLPPRHEAVLGIHRPPHDTPPEKLTACRTKAHKRMIFEELFLIECAMAILRSRNTERVRGVSIPAADAQYAAVTGRLPFELTADQQAVLQEILSDLRGDHPMNRLVQGDVGCGKTVVAAVTLTLAAMNGFQGVLMAPTEILAEQHFNNIAKMDHAFPLRVELLTSGTKNKDEIRARAAAGKIDLLIGTHALIQQSVAFANLGVAVIDEQHRFGVMQRAELMKKGARPNTLIMTATPIPRTLAMTLYGDLDVSSIRTMPKGRQAVETTVIRPSEKAKAHLLINNEVKKGRQAYIIYPLVDESEKSELKAATVMWKVFQDEVFPHLRVGLVHGRMKQDEKNDVMHRFMRREVDVLVSTTVIEVGIDQPNATVMMIEHAERFGLAQLHQLRGRVGRGADKSFCLLAIEYPMSAVAKARLKVMTETGDGFVIAEKDMELRGTGDLLGTRQSGLPSLRMANLVRDFEILKFARNEAFELVRADPELQKPEHQCLRAEMQRDWRERFQLVDVG